MPLHYKKIKKISIDDKDILMILFMTLYLQLIMLVLCLWQFENKLIKMKIMEFQQKSFLNLDSELMKDRNREREKEGKNFDWKSH